MRKRLLVSLGAVSAIGLSACTATSDDHPPSVPTLSTSGSVHATNATQAPTDADAGRPRLRIDMTTDEQRALYAHYHQCMAAHGWSKTGDNRTGRAALKKARQACRSKEPLPAWQYDVNNPHAEDFLHAVVQCLRDKGVQYVNEEPPQGGRVILSFGGPNNDHKSVMNGMKYLPDCEKQVAAKGIGR